MGNYRKLFKKHYNIDFGKDYHIHHIDLDRNNNNIENLMILPSKLHNQYHLLLNAVRHAENFSDKTFDAKIRSSIMQGDRYNAQMARQLLDIVDECNEWYDYKLYLDGILPNVHNIRLKVK